MSEELIETTEVDIIEATPQKKADREEDARKLNEAVSRNIPHLTAAALAAAVGSTVVLKMKMGANGKMKYIPCNNTEEIIQALEWIAEYGNDFSDRKDGGFYIIQQKAPDSKFWDALTNRHLGKIPDEAKIDISQKIDLAAIGRKAAEYTIRDNKKLIEPIPSSWS